MGEVVVGDDREDAVSVQHPVHHNLRRELRFLDVTRDVLGIVCLF